MKYIDLHADTLMHTSVMGIETLMHNDKLSVDIQRLQNGDAMAQFFAIFMPDATTWSHIGREPMDDWAYIDALQDHLFKGIAKYEDHIAFATNYPTLAANQMANKLSAFLTLEDGRPITHIDHVERLYKLGIRLITLTWNHENDLGYPNHNEPSQMNKGLKPLGIEVVEAMNALGMLIDVSHLSDGGFKDVIDHTQAPIVASHSNARSLSAHSRNLTDTMIKQIADTGGIIGLNFCGNFLNEDITNSDSRINRMVKHLDHIYQIGGAEVVALGSDFDGIGGDLEIDGPDKMNRLFDALWQAGWSYGTIEKFSHQNALRVIKDTLK